MSVLRIMDPKAGDIAVEWGVADQESVDRARLAFETAAAKPGNVFYSMNAKGTEGKVIKTFDPQAEQIVGHPMVVGG